MQNNMTRTNRANVVGSLWMVAAMACFAIEDVFVKAAAETLPVGQLLILFGLGGTCVCAVAARASGAVLFSPAVLSKPMRIRAGFEVAGRLFYALAVALTPLSAATVILQATPIVVVAGAALFFGETVGWRRWFAIVLGLTGVLIILQPGTESFSAMSMLAVLGMFGFAGRDLASRAAPRSLGISVLGFYGFLAIVVAGVIYALYERAAFVLPSPAAGLYLLGAILVSVPAYTGLMIAMRTGEISAVAPFRYSRLPFGVLCGVILFGETLSPWILLGGALIVLSGMIILWRSKSVAR